MLKVEQAQEIADKEGSLAGDNVQEDEEEYPKVCIDEENEMEQEFPDCIFKPDDIWRSERNQSVPEHYNSTSSRSYLQAATGDTNEDIILKNDSSPKLVPLSCVQKPKEKFKKSKIRLGNNPVPSQKEVTS